VKQPEVFESSKVRRMRQLWSTTEQRRQSPRWRISVIGLAAAIWLFPASAMAHSGPPPVPETLWTTWNLDPFVLLTLTAAVCLYIRGVRAIWARAGRDRGVRTWQVMTVLGGYFTIAVALVSPLDPLSSALLSAHMGQHILLITIAPLMLIVGDVSSASLWGLPASWRRRVPGIWRSAGHGQAIWHLLTRPLSALILHSLVLWTWHIPVLYDAAIRSEPIHAAEHLTMFGTAALLWWIVIQRGRQAGTSYGIGMLLLAGIVLQKTALGALITFSPTPWYTEYAASTAAWGLTPFEDQQLAGAVLMGPGGFIYLVVGVSLFAGWMRAIERSVDRHEAYTSARLATDTGSNQAMKENG
jgi:putative membrane protein